MQNGNEKKAELSIVISDKVDFKTKLPKKDAEDHYIMTKGWIQEEEIAVINLYVPNIRAPKYIKQQV